MTHKRTILALLVAAMAGLGQGALFAQVPVTSGLRLWLEADAGVQTSGTSVTNWLDQSGNANHAAQSTVADQPTYLTSGFGGANKPSVHFDGLNDFLEAGTGLDITGSGLTVFALLRLASTTLDAAYMGDYSNFGGTDPRGYLLGEGADGKFFFYAGGPSNAITAAGAADSTIGRPTILTGEKDPSFVTLYTNGAQAAQAAIAESILSSPTNFILGQNGWSVGYLNGDVAEVLIYDRSLTAQERANVNAYFDGKYSLGIPEPSSALLTALAVAAFGVVRRRGLPR